MHFTLWLCVYECKHDGRAENRLGMNKESSSFKLSFDPWTHPRSAVGIKMILRAHAYTTYKCEKYPLNIIHLSLEIVCWDCSSPKNDHVSTHSSE